MNETRIGEILVGQGRVSSEQLSLALDIQRLQDSSPLGLVLKQYGFADDQDIARAVSDQMRWPLFEGSYEPDMNAVEVLGRGFCLENHVLPVRDSGACGFVFPVGYRTEITDEIRKRQAFKKAVFYVGAEDRIIEALRVLKESTTESLSVIDEQADLNQYLSSMLNIAVGLQASDIHFESSQHAMEIRVRVDGVLHYRGCLPLALVSRMTNIIFSRAGVQHSDFSRFHDARFEHRWQNKVIDVRVSHVPSIYGSSVVLRLLDKHRVSLPMTHLGYTQRQLDYLNVALNKPEGMILLCGPTGCGKTTTLYSILSQVKSITTKILTVEDPVEIRLPLVSQVAINPKMEITFESAIKHFLRHDPDVILIGEIRDPQTAQMAVRAAITGHKVYSTIHTTTPLDSLNRLRDLGVSPSYLASSLLCLIGQRLVRRLCPRCKIARNAKTYRDSGVGGHYCDEDLSKVFVAGGCPDCLDGYRGRRVVSEILMVDDEIRDLIVRHKDAELYDYVRRQSAPWSFRNQARELVRNAETSPEELMRVLG